MMGKTIVSRLGILSASGMFLASAVSPALAEQVVLKQGTNVKLVFDSSLNSKTAHEGQRVQFHVSEPVVVDGKTVIAAGTPASGQVTKVQKRGRFGVNAHIQLLMNPIRTASGVSVPIGFKTKGQDVSSRTGNAAAASIGSAVVLGPIGLVAGLFIPGKTVNEKPGDKMTVTVDQDVPLNIK